MMRLLVPLSVLALSACSSVDCVDLSGEWSLEVTGVDSSCGPEDDWSNTIEITQAMCEATQIDVAGIKGDPASVTGSLDGDRIVISGSFEDAGGITELTFTLTQDTEDTFTGTEDWEWFASASDTEPTCTDGTANVSITRL